MTRLLRTFSLVVTDRRWAAPLTAIALGFGLFIGVAIGPSASGTLAGVPRVIELIEPGRESAEPVESGPEAFAGASGGGFEETAPEAFPAAAPLAPEPLPEPVEAAPARAAAPAPPPAEEPVRPEGTELEGTVVHVNPAAGSYALAVKGGELVPIHSRELPKPGTELTVSARRLANGTFAEEDPPERTGKAAQATFTGVVTWTTPPAPSLEDPYGPPGGGTPLAYTVSGRGASLLVYVEPDPTGAPARLPEIGAYVKVSVAIGAEPTLVQRALTVEPGEPSTYLDLAGILGDVAPDGARLLLSADDTRQGEADLTLAIPPEIDASLLKQGDSYLATAEVQPDATLLLKGIVGDEHTKGAEDASSAQGDLRRSGEDQP